MWTSFATATLAVLAPFTVEQNPTSLSRVIGSGGRVYSASGALTTEGDSGIYTLLNFKAYESIIGKPDSQREILEPRLADQLLQKINAATTTSDKGFHDDNLLQDRWLVVRASSWDKKTDEVRIYVVVDTKTSRTFTFNGYPNHTRLTNMTVGAAGPNWAVLNVEQAATIDRSAPNNLTPRDPAVMFLMSNGRETKIGYGSAAGADNQGRIYATEEVDEKGNPVPPATPGAISFAKIYNNGNWKRLGEGRILHVLADGTFLASRTVNGTTGHYIVKNNKWNRIERKWDAGVSPYQIANDGTVLLSGMKMPDRTANPGRFRPYFSGAILRHGVVTPFSDLLPENFELNHLPVMAADGLVVVNGEIGDRSTAFVIRPE